MPIILFDISIFGLEAQLDIPFNDGNAPPNSQWPQSFHPNFDREVFMIVFSVSAIIFSW